MYKADIDLTNPLVHDARCLLTMCSRAHREVDSGRGRESEQQGQCGDDRAEKPSGYSNLPEITGPHHVHAVLLIFVCG